MATIKSFTSLEQSKKLLELGLRPETADMYWDYDENTQSLSEAMAIPIYEGSWELHHKNWSKDIPCWSLAALLGVLPEYHLSSPNPLCSMYCCRVEDIETYANNQVDACYETVIHLHELKML